MPLFKDPRYLGEIRGYVSVGDFNGDGLSEPLFFLNQGNGLFDRSVGDSIDLILQAYPNRSDRSAGLLDVDGDGHLDVFWNVYSTPENEESFSLVLFGNGDGTFTRFEERRDVKGFGETIVVADFNNDNFTDVFVPVYTHVPGSDSSYLLFNEQGVLGSNKAVEWGVGLGNLPVFYRVEGAQAVDYNFDGLIDLYVGSHLFINEGDRFSQNVLDQYIFDEGASFFDFDNDGDFDVVLRGDELPPRLLLNNGGSLEDQGYIVDNVDGGDGLKVFDIDSNGWEDIIFGTHSGLTILLNDRGVFSRYDVPSVPYSPSFAFFDYDNDGRIDVVGQPGGTNPAGVPIFLLENEMPKGDSFSLTVLGSGGELNQHGRSIRITSHEEPTIVMARAVESGSGYLTQSEYKMLIGLPGPGVFEVEIAFAAGGYRFWTSKFTDVRAFADGHVSIIGSDAEDVMMGGVGADLLDGGPGDDTVFGSEGADSIHGGTGNDTVDFSYASGPVLATLEDGTATVGGAAQSLTGVENLVGSPFHDSLIGDTFGNSIAGGAGNDFIDGGPGADEMSGGPGEDIYAIDNAGDVVLESPGFGLDEIRTMMPTFVLPANVEMLTGTSDQGQQLIGNAQINIFAGGSGSDTFVGLEGDDVYLVADADIVVEQQDAGLDWVHTDLLQYILPEHVEGIRGSSDIGQTFFGNAGNNLFEAQSGSNVFYGREGDDIFTVGGSDEVIEVSDQGFDQVLTSLSSYSLPENVEKLTGISDTGQHLQGNSLANVISGGLGADVFSGGGGNDVYHVAAGDQVVELAGEGVDEVITSLPIYALGDNLENLRGTSTRGQKLIGNHLANEIRGSQGIDTLIGQAGDDIYFVNHEFDFIYENPSEGFDAVRASGNYALWGGAAIELLEAEEASSLAPMYLAGNEFANTIRGNAGNNVLDGGGGADVMQGSDGDDVYGIDNAGDVVIEAAGQGYDQVATFVSYTLTDAMSIEVLYARDITQTTALYLAGNSFANTIRGNAGNNVLDGGGGADVMLGFGGEDEFVFSTPLGAENVESIPDFAPGVDTIVLRDLIFSGLRSGELLPNQFHVGDTASDLSQRIIYNPATGALFFDSDGQGGAAQIAFALLQPGLTNLAASDFLIL